MFTDHLKNIWYGHLLNVWYAASVLSFDYVALVASNARFLRRGVEDLVRGTRYSKISEAPWLQDARIRTRQEILAGLPGTPDPAVATFDSVFAGLDVVRGSSQHEGSWFPKTAALSFSEFLRRPTGVGECPGLTREELASELRAIGSHPAEELLLQTQSPERVRCGSRDARRRRCSRAGSSDARRRRGS